MYIFIAGKYMTQKNRKLDIVTRGILHVGNKK